MKNKVKIRSVVFTITECGDDDKASVMILDSDYDEVVTMTGKEVLGVSRILDDLMEIVLAKKTES